MLICGKKNRHLYSLPEGTGDHMEVSWNRANPQIIQFNGRFPSKPSSYWGTPYFRKPPYFCRPGASAFAARNDNRWRRPHHREPPEFLGRFFRWFHEISLAKSVIKNGIQRGFGQWNHMQSSEKFFFHLMCKSGNWVGIQRGFGQWTCGKSGSGKGRKFTKGKKTNKFHKEQLVCRH